jgi:ribosomal protein S14
MLIGMREMDTSKKNFRLDRSCESCGHEGAALVSDDIDATPHYLCETCMKLGLSRRMSTEEIVTLVEKHWGTGADAAEIDKCPKCGSDRVLIRSIDGERYFVKCGCETREGFKSTRFFRI